MATFEDSIEADVRWRPFQLDASLPKGKGVSKLEAYERKFGADRVASMIPYMKKVGAEHGIDFSYGGSIGNTFDSHRFLWQARETGGSVLQNALVDRLFAAYFENEQSAGDPAVLRECAEEAGFPTDVVDRLLSDETVGKAGVESELNEFRRKWNCTGVPLFVVDGRIPVRGAGSPDDFAEVFRSLLG